jgi:hypothetical protein
MRLHAVSCGYIGPFDERWKSTTTPKLCFAEWRELDEWVRRNAIRLKTCRDCKVDPPV